MTETDFLEGQILLVDKPLDWTSFQAVNKLKYKLKREFKLPKKFKIGHAGTLDPRATGLLIVCTGKFTKKIPEIQDAPKEYWTEIKIGVQTESYDTEKPEILHQDFSNVTEDDVHNALEKFLGEIEQVPPIYSAVKVLIMLENSFNKIWKINKKRSITRRVIDYIAIIFLGPIFFVLLSALNSIAVEEIARHFSGNPINQDKLKYLKETYNIKILEDCAHSIGASFKGIKAGSCKNSDISIFSSPRPASRRRWTW